MMKILSFARDYANRVGGSPGYLEQLEVFCRRLPWEVEDITAEMCDEYLTESLRVLSPQTVANHRRMLTTLMTEAKRMGLNACITRPFRRVKVPRPTPRAWSREEIAQLVAAARKTEGHFRDLKKSLFLEAWLLSGYCLGLRAGDLWALRWDQVRGRRIYVTLRKTSSPFVAVFTDEALAACKALPRRQKIFGDFAALNTIQQWIASCAKRAGVEGSSKYLRRSCATYSKVLGRSPKRALGHLTDGLAERHYVDQLLYEEEANINSEPLPSVLRPE